MPFIPYVKHADEISITKATLVYNIMSTNINKTIKFQKIQNTTVILYNEYQTLADDTPTDTVNG